LLRGRLIRFSQSLAPVYYEQLASERRVIRYVRGQPRRRFERVSSRARAEALDCMVYAFAARAALTLNLDIRQRDLAGIARLQGSLASQIAGASAPPLESPSAPSGNSGRVVIGWNK
jgi:phage terminase large subunit GpA-like protein